MDKYEAFKQYLHEINFAITEYHTGTDHANMDLTENMFNIFEHHYNETKKEKEIKKILKKYLIPVRISNKTINEHGIDKCYNELKKRGYLK